MGKKVILSFGGNLGEPLETFKKATYELISQNILKILKLSSVYRSVSLLKDRQPSYLNLICLAETELSAPDLLNKLKNTERAFGREENGHWQPRTLDIDIIDYNGEVINTPALTLPHKEAENRAFVLIPLAEIYPQYTHPLSGKTAADLCAQLSDDLGTERVSAL
jgi:2-amino-4-hydroxy-6-hydroxymethyldihydropteridine diphosphokinase